MRYAVSPAAHGNIAIRINETDDITSTEDQIIPADVSVSGGSDTEATRGQKDAEANRGRTATSAKKPATFKAVPINKKFLTKTTTPSPTAKPADQNKSGTNTPPTGTSSLSASRPRLVAKTGNAGRDASPRLSAVNGGKPGSAPDPAAVWNKNQRMSRLVPEDEVAGANIKQLYPYRIPRNTRMRSSKSMGFTWLVA